MEYLKCYTLNEMVEIITNLSDIDTALDIINKNELNQIV
jgi:hypothetical protein